MRRAVNFGISSQSHQSKFSNAVRMTYEAYRPMSLPGRLATSTGDHSANILKTRVDLHIDNLHKYLAARKPYLFQVALADWRVKTPALFMVVAPDPDDADTVTLIRVATAGEPFRFHLTPSPLPLNPINSSNRQVALICVATAGEPLRFHARRATGSAQFVNYTLVVPAIDSKRMLSPLFWVALVRWEGQVSRIYSYLLPWLARRSLNDILREQRRQPTAYERWRIHRPLTSNKPVDSSLQNAATLVEVFFVLLIALGIPACAAHRFVLDICVHLVRKCRDDLSLLGQMPDTQLSVVEGE